MPKSVGRPSLKSDSRVQILLDALARPMPMNIACDFAGVDRRTPMNWAKKDKGFLLQMAYARAKGIGLAIDKTMLKDPWKILKNIDPDDFKDEVQIQQKSESILTITAPDGSKEEIDL